VLPGAAVRAGLVVAGLVLVAGLAAVGRSPVRRGPGLLDNLGGAAPQAVTAAQAPPAGPSGAPGGAVADLAAGGLVLLLIYFAVLLVIGVVGFVAMIDASRRRRVRGGPTAPVPAPAESDGAQRARLRAATAAAMSTMDELAPGDADDAVIAAWLLIERAAGELGTPRAPHQTATEYAADVLAGQHVDERALTALRVRYQRARYGGRLSAADVDAARAALGALERELRPAGAADA
jgi:hypothetical protein